MIFKYIIALLFLTFTGVVCGQDMEQFLDSMPADQEVVYTQMKKYLSDKRSQDSYPIETQSKAAMAMARSSIYTGRFDEAITYTKGWLRYTDSIAYNERREVTLNMIAGAHHYKGEPDSALYYWNEAAKSAEINNNLSQLASLQNNIGVVYMDRDMYDMALERFKSSWKATLALGDSTQLTNIISNLAESYQELGVLDSAKYYAEFGVALGEKYNDDYTLMSSLRPLAAYYTLKGNKIRGKELYERILVLSEKQGLKRPYNMAMLNLAALVDDPKEAKEYADEVKDYWLERDNAFLGAYKILIDVYEANDDYENAYVAAKLAFERVDSLGKNEVEAQYTELSAKFDLSEKERMIAERNGQLAKQDLEQSRLYNILFGLLGVGGLLGIFFYYRNKAEKDRRKIKDEEFNTRLAQLETMVLKSQMNPHFIFNSLNSIRYLFMKDQKDQGLKYITKFAKLLRSTLHHGDQALVPLKDEVELTELYISLEQLRFDEGFGYGHSFPEGIDWESLPLPPFTIQPIVENAFWHGLNHKSIRDKQLFISIEENAGITKIIIEDSGIGYGKGRVSTDQSVNKKKSYGLNLIKERFQLMNNTQEYQYDISVDQTGRYTTGTAVIITITK